jgi:hypothetical protein
MAHASNAMVFAQLSALHRLLVVAVLPSAAGIESPCLNRCHGAASDVDVAPRRRDAEALDARERRTIAD